MNYHLCMATMTLNIKTDLDNAIKLYGDEFATFYKNYEAKLQELQTRLKEANKDASRLEYYKWLDFDYLLETNKKTQALAKEIKAKNYKNAIVYGMGGSGINSLVLKNSLYELMPKSKKNSAINLIIQNNLDPNSMQAKLESVAEELDQTLFIIISKSGGTDEVRRSVNSTLDFWKAQGGFSLEKFAAQTVVITEPPREGKTNFLHQLREELKTKTNVEIPFLENDPNIGGRFSLFSPVGMFTAELIGLDSNALINGAKAVFENFISTEANENTIAKLAAFDIFLSKEKQVQNRYSMVYADCLEAVNKFRAQLKGESLNKDGINSTVHIPGIGTVNHHSDLELLLKKNNNLVLEQVFFKTPAADHTNAAELECFKDLENGSNHQALLDKHINPLFTYITESGAAVIQTELANQDETCIAQFAMQDMLTTVVQAGLQDKEGEKELLDLAIRQWEVERYKKSLKK